MAERQELNDPLLKLNELAKKRLITRREFVYIPIVFIGTGLAKSIPLLAGTDARELWGAGIDNVLSATMLAAGINTCLLLGADLIRATVVQQAIDEVNRIKKAKYQ